jgi:pimeloyl-ACP methyl ester carboxylesterase
MSPPVRTVRRYLVGDDAPSAVVNETLTAMRSVSPEVRATRLRAIMNLDVTRELAKSRVPMRIVAGQNDRLVKVTNAYPAFDASRILELPGPHTVLQRCPIEAARIIDDFAMSLVDAP